MLGPCGPWPACRGTPMPPSTRALAAGPCMAAALLLVAGCTDAAVSDAPAPPGDPPSASSSVPPPAEGVPVLEVSVVAEGLDHPWDVVQSADGTLLVDERAGGFTAVLPDGGVQEVRADLD